MNFFIIKIILEIENVYSNDCLELYSTLKSFQSTLETFSHFSPWNGQ